jgi:uncharacterized protein YdeI (YjbR/CyaY-like superfamily)
MEARYFADVPELADWFEQNHATEDELVLGFYKRGSGIASFTNAEALDLALCYGWIDGIRRRVDDKRYTNRYTPRRPNSIWSAVNIAKAHELIAAGAMRPAGLAAFERRSERRMNLYSSEQDQVAFDDEQEARFRANESAWYFFSTQPAGYRKTSIWWVISAKRPETRDRRLSELIKVSSEFRRLDSLSPRTKSST